MNVLVTVALADLHKGLEPYYSEIGRPSIDPAITTAARMGTELSAIHRTARRRR